MSTAKYFSGTVEVSSIRWFSNDECAQRWPEVKCVKVDGYSRMAGYAPGSMHDGQELPVTRVIYYKSNPSLHKCDARCTHAKGRNCECSCGGANHGSQA